MKTQDVVFIQTGQTQGSWGVLCFYDTFRGNLQETCTRLYSNEDHRPTIVPLYKVSSIKMPAWMDEETYKLRETELRYAVALGGDFVYHYNERQFNNFTSLGDNYKFVIGWMEQKRGGRNQFMNGLLHQVDVWMQQENHQWPVPLSQPQWEAATKYCPLYNAKKIAARCYHRR